MQRTNFQRTTFAISLAIASGLAAGGAHAAVAGCPAVASPLAADPATAAPLAPEFALPARTPGASQGVLGHALDQSLSVDDVLLRLRAQQQCLALAKAVPATGAPLPSAAPGAYQPKTQFDNTPWRFDMSQNGKRMTAEEFDAWMKARGVRVAKGAPGTTPAPTAPVAPPPDDTQRKQDERQ